MKRALITGAADGIGRALAERLQKAGWAVVGLDVDEGRLAGAPFEFEICDLASESSIASVLRRFEAAEPFDLVVHNAGISCAGRFETSDIEQQVVVLAVNLRAPLLLTAGLLKAERLRDGGSVAFLSSLSHQVSYPGAAVYAATKDGLTSYARSLSVALAPRQVNVLTVFPGPVRTAHARRYSPPGSSEKGRLEPDVLAAKIEKALLRRRRILLPGGGAKVFAFLGRWAPWLTESAMKKAILDKMDA